MTKKIVQAIKKAKEAVDNADSLDEEQRKIAFQTVLSELLKSDTLDTVPKKESSTSVPVMESESIEELYNRLAPKGHMNTAMFLAYNFHKNGKPFTTSDIISGFRKILVSPPANARDIINKNRKKGFIMDVESDDKGRSVMQITRLGIIYVENGFKRDGNGNS